MAKKIKQPSPGPLRVLCVYRETLKTKTGTKHKIVADLTQVKWKWDLSLGAFVSVPSISKTTPKLAMELIHADTFWAGKPDARFNRFVEEQERRLYHGALLVRQLHHGDRD